jgi:probable metal-binding protein
MAGSLNGVMLAAVEPHPPKTMTTCVAVHGQEIVDLIRANPNGIRLSQLAESVFRRYGSSAVFHTNSRIGLDLDDLLVLLEARNQLSIVRGVVYPAGYRR